MPQFVLKSPIVRFGVAYRAGQAIELTEAAGQSLIDAGIAKAQPKPPATTKPKAKSKTKAKAKATPEPEPSPTPEPEPAPQPAPIKTIEAQEIQ